LSLVENPALLKFRNLVSMDDLPAMRARNAEYIILHKRYEAQLSQVMMPLPAFERLCHNYQKELGAPVYEDANIIVFRL
jgi:hypothetical protein